MSSFGLDIGTNSMKAVYLVKNGLSVVFRSSIVAETPASGMSADASLDQEEVAQTIRKMVVDAKIPAREVHLALPDNLVYAKVISMPVLSDKELASAIYWEAEQHIPVPLESISLDYKILKRDNSKQKVSQMHVLLVGAPYSVLNRYKKIFELSGIDISSLETEMLSVLRSTVTENYPDSLIINIGSLGTSIAIVQKGLPLFLYSIPLGGLSMNRSIATEFGFSAKQAEEYKKIYGLEDATFGGKIRTAIEPILMSLITEIKKALSYYTEKNKEEYPIKQIILSGGTARLPGIAPIFVKHTGIETVIVNPWKSLNINGVPQELTERGPEYAIAVGLAIKTL
jgi:type IV pilus assembly protein PilM